MSLLRVIEEQASLVPIHSITVSPSFFFGGQSMSINVLVVSLVTALASTAVANSAPRVIITEIMYNPASNENKGETEWVEIANVGDVAIDIKNWRLADNTEKRAKKWGTFNCTLGPGEVAVLINADAVTPEQFHAAWDAPGEGGQSESTTYQVIGVKWGSLRNNPGEKNLGLQLLNEKEEAICTVNYRDGGAWPNCSKPDGGSIWLTDVSATDFSNGKLWKKSETGKDSARASAKSDVFDKENAGSPGTVTKASAPTEVATTQPADSPTTKPASSTTEY
jgi:hypothetical protein